MDVIEKRLKSYCQHEFKEASLKVLLSGELFGNKPPNPTHNEIVSEEIVPKKKMKPSDYDVFYG